MSVLSKIASIINEIKKPAFRIESANEEPERGLIYFLVRIEDKGVPPIKKDPIDLVREVKTKKCFSRKDYDWIIDMLLENQKRLIEYKYKKNIL